jgi:hypothetical protein
MSAGFLNLDYDPTTIEADNSFSPLPSGDYLFEIESAEVKESKKNANNKYMSLRLSVISADYTGKKVFPIINFKNDNEVAQKIGAAQLGELMRACGMTNSPNLTAEAFVGRHVYGKTKIKENPGYDPKAEVVKFSPAEKADKPDFFK